MKGTYDETAKLVNDEIAKLGDTGESDPISLDTELA